MNPLRRITALPLALVILWTMVIAPAAVARCEHACGASHLHAIGAPCGGDTGEDRCPAGDCHDDTPGKKSGGECKAFEAGDATLGENAPLKTPSPMAFIAVHATVIPVFVRHDVADIVANRPQGPPDSPPRETHGRGALPLLI